MPTHDPHRESRIEDEIIVDCYDDSEVEMAWFYYFADGLEFPFEATANLKIRGGQTEEKTVQVVEIDSRSEQGRSLKIGIVEAGSERVQFISPADLVAANTTAENLQILNDWRYNENMELLAA